MNMTIDTYETDIFSELEYLKQKRMFDGYE